MVKHVVTTYATTKFCCECQAAISAGVECHTHSEFDCKQDLETAIVCTQCQADWGFITTTEAICYGQLSERVKYARRRRHLSTDSWTALKNRWSDIMERLQTLERERRENRARKEMEERRRQCYATEGLPKRPWYTRVAPKLSEQQFDEQFSFGAS